MAVGEFGGRPEQEPCVCVVGGCHVVGHAVGVNRGFAVVAARELCGDAVRVEAVPYVRFRHAGKMLSACEQVRPKILIVQCGNFEATPPPFRLRWSNAPEPRRVPTSTEVGDDARFRLTIATRLRFMAKRIGDRAIRWRGFDLEKTSGEIDRFLAAVAETRVPRVAVLTPLRTMDPVINRYRSLVSVLVQRACAQHGVVCVDTWESLQDPALFLPDGVHLNEEGHRVLSSSVVTALRRGGGACCVLREVALVV